MKGPARVEFMPIKDGDIIDLNDEYGGKTVVHQLGFKPGPARSRSGWLVLLVHEGEHKTRDYQGRSDTLTIPKTHRPRKLRGPRAS